MITFLVWLIGILVCVGLGWLLFGVLAQIAEQTTWKDVGRTVLQSALYVTLLVAATGAMVFYLNWLS